VILDLGVVVAGYLLGCLPVARVVAGRVGVDPTAAGSGNPGASNVYRTAGRRAGAAVLLGDVAKGAVAAAAGLAAGDRLLGLAAGLAAVVGHVAPAPSRFRGGRGVATAAGVVAVLYPLAAVVVVPIWVAIVALSSLASLASVVAVIVLFALLAGGGVPGAELALAAVLAAVVLVRHTGNIGRLLRGAERPIRGDFPSSGSSWPPIATGHRSPSPGADHR
jgi:glycerol-3-phosphate acyltransferase PlsY